METIVKPSNTNVIYVSAQYGSFSRSDDGGSNRIRIFNDSTAEAATQEVVSLPIHPALSPTELEQIAYAVAETVAANQDPCGEHEQRRTDDCAGEVPSTVVLRIGREDALGVMCRVAVAEHDSEGQQVGQRDDEGDDEKRQPRAPTAPVIIERR